MKSILTFLLVCTLSLSLQAAIITVDNNTVSAGQYTNLQLAADNASTGDTLHVLGSLSSYGNLTLEKQLTIIGAGYNSPNQFNLSTQIGTLYFSQNLPNNSSGSKIMGCTISTLSWWVNNVAYTGITIERCNITNLSLSNNQCSGWLIQNNIISTINMGYNASIVVRNNVITSQISSSDEGTVLITNNLFSSTTSSGNVFSSVSHAIISNNIFYQGRSPLGVSSGTFNNNITFGTSNNTLPYGNNTGANNQVGVDPQFANVSTTGFDYGNDYRLSSGSPGVNAGSDGTDIGIYGNTKPFPIGGPAPYLTSAPPRIPQIVELNLLNNTIFQGDSLTVQVRARKQN